LLLVLAEAEAKGGAEGKGGRAFLQDYHLGIQQEAEAEGMDAMAVVGCKGNCPSVCQFPRPTMMSLHRSSMAQQMWRI
jgi:hypothetical protein